LVDYGRCGKKNGLAIVGIKQRSQKEFVYVIINKPSVRRDEALPLLQQHVVPGTILTTDGGSIYKGIDNLSLQAWDYYAHDILNAIYLQADYKLSSIKLSAQYINESDVGSALAGSVDSNYWAVKAGTSFGDLSGYVAYSQTGESSGSMNGGIITPWGGMPAFTQGMVTRHQFFADTDTWKVAATYDFNNLTNLNLKATAYYASFDVGAKNTYTNSAFEAAESGFDIKYQATKALNLRLRGNFPTDFKPGLDWAEYRFIANYNF